MENHPKNRPKRSVQLNHQLLFPVIEGISNNNDEQSMDKNDVLSKLKLQQQNDNTANRYCKYKKRQISNSSCNINDNSDIITRYKLRNSQIINLENIRHFNIGANLTKDNEDGDNRINDYNGKKKEYTKRIINDYNLKGILKGNEKKENDGNIKDNNQDEKKESNDEKNETENALPTKHELKVKFDDNTKGINNNKESIRSSKPQLKKKSLIPGSEQYLNRSKTFIYIKRKYLNYTQLDRPPNYCEIEKYWSFEKNILDCQILELASKL